MKKIVETDLYEPVKTLFEKNGYLVYGEVQYCDIAAVKDELLVIVELKTHFNMDLLYQAIKRQRLTDDVFIAIPKTKVIDKKWKDLSLLVKRLGLGLIMVYFYKEVYAEVLIEPALFDIARSQKQSKRKKTRLLKEISSRSVDLNVGGSSKRKLMTAYKEQSLYIACLLEKLGPLSPKNLRSLGAHPKKTNSILSKNFYHWFYRIQKGLYDLTDTGKDAILQFDAITDLQKKEIEKLLIKDEKLEKIRKNTKM